MKRVLVVGEINVDLILSGYQAFPAPGREVLVDDFRMTVGSASVICAMGLARLGTPVSFLGKVGADPWGDFCLSAMAQRGIDLTRVIRDPALKTGVTVSLTSARDRALVTYLGSIAALSAEDVTGPLAGFAHVHVSSYFLQERLRPACRDLFARAHADGLTTSLDPGFDPAESWGRDLVETLEETDLFFPNEVELAAVSGCQQVEAGLRRLATGRVRTVAKLGGRGCATLEDAAFVQVPAFLVEPVDTTGAGDSFDAGFLHGFLGGLPIGDCLRLGAACGALATLGPGGTTSQPDAAAALAFLARHA